MRAPTQLTFLATTRCCTCCSTSSSTSSGASRSGSGPGSCVTHAPGLRLVDIYRDDPPLLPPPSSPWNSRRQTRRRFVALPFRQFTRSCMVFDLSHLVFPSSSSRHNSLLPTTLIRPWTYVLSLRLDGTCWIPSFTSVAIMGSRDLSIQQSKPRARAKTVRSPDSGLQTLSKPLPV